MLIRKYGPLVLSSFIGALVCFVLTQTDLVSKAHAARNAQCAWIDGYIRPSFMRDFDRYIAEGWELKSTSVIRSPGDISRSNTNDNDFWYFAVFCR